MVSTADQSRIKAIISQQLAIPVSSFRAEVIGGGSINDTYKLVINGSLRFFCKINSTEKFPRLFEKEKHGIECLGNQHIIRVPRIIACESQAQNQALILEWIEQGLKTEKFWANFGEQLAALHHTSSSFFGFGEDNYMGALPQSNKPSATWIDFLIHERFVPQIALALKKNLLEAGHARQFEKLYKKLEDIFPIETPSLLHGDLWSGNFLADETGNPVLIDPAVYFGHCSMDLAMTTLFGGYDKIFYKAYHYHFPFPNNYREQWEICNLYPLLIHLNLFGKSYQSEIVRTIKHY